MSISSTFDRGPTIQPVTERISVIVPTIGRPQSLERLLVSLVQQTQRVDEVVIADGSSTTETAEVAARSEWAERGLRVTRIPMQPPHAVRQREAAIAASSGELLLLLDDDVELEPDCVAELVDAMDSGPDVVAVMADFSNQPWPVPTRAWRLYLRLVHGLRDGAWQGRVIGPLLRFGYNPVPGTTVTMDWHGAGNTLIRRAAFVKVGGFSPFFLSRATINEDVDLALKLGRVGRILFCPKARMAHFHAPGGRLDSYQAAEDDLHNR